MNDLINTLLEHHGFAQVNCLYKRNDNGLYCILNLVPDLSKIKDTNLINALAKPVVIVPTEQGFNQTAEDILQGIYNQVVVTDGLKSEDLVKGLASVKASSKATKTKTASSVQSASPTPTKQVEEKVTVSADDVFGDMSI